MFLYDFDIGGYMEYKYKFEHFKYADFPVYSSRQMGEGIIVVPHHHKAVEVLMVLDGECSVNIDSAVFTCTKNDVVFIPPYSVHTVTGLSKDSALKGIVFELPLLENPQTAVCLEDLLDKSIMTNYKLNCNLNEIKSVIEKFSLDDENSNPAFRLRILSMLYEITAILLQNFNNKACDDNSRIRPAIDYIKENFSRPISISELSQTISVCDDHFIRLFKSATNKTPVKYINDFRVEQALRLMIDSEMSITEVSEAVGFSSVNYMTKLFKDTLNISPSKYRKSAIQKRK